MYVCHEDEINMFKLMEKKIIAILRIYFLGLTDPMRGLPAMTLCLLLSSANNVYHSLNLDMA